MSLHKLTAGDGYTYLTRQVAAADATSRGFGSLGDYYAQRGESPGEWLGRGLVGLPQFSAEGGVTEAQMRALWGEGRHPDAERIEAEMRAAGHGVPAILAATRLGSPYRVYEGVNEFRRRCAAAYGEVNAVLGLPRDWPVPGQDRAAIRTQIAVEMFCEEYGRDPVDDRERSGFLARISRQATTAVAGFDLTFSPVKSVSALWAVAPRAVGEQVEAAHRAAVTDVLAWLEDHAAYTRTGPQGVAQEEVTGLLAAAFVHRDSRAGDPDLHTHVAISNKVQTVRDGRWLALDGRPIHANTVAASERYNTRLEAELTARLGVAFEERPGTEPGKRAVRELVGMDPRLLSAWSKRRKAIDAKRAELAADFQSRHGRPPSVVEALHLAQQANLVTRDRKHEPRSHAEQRATWAGQAEQVLGGPDAVTDLVRGVLGAGRRPRSWSKRRQRRWVEQTAAAVVVTVQESRATWRENHVRAEAQRAARTAEIGLEQLEVAVDAVVARALSSVHSIPLDAVDPVTDPDQLRRRDGVSVFEVSGAGRYTSPAILAAEESLLHTAGLRDGWVVAFDAVEIALLESAANGVVLNPGQVQMVRQMACSGARLQVGLAPAGTGKTTAMRVLARAWTDSGGSVLGLAPSAAAAAVLREDLGAHTDTLAKLQHALARHAETGRDLPGWAARIGPRSMVLIDEAAMASTTALAEVTAFVYARGGDVRMIGDDQQLAAIGAGGVLRDIAETQEALTLSQVMRFTDRSEGPASLALREGDPSSIAFYTDHGRIDVGDLAVCAEHAYTAWSADRAAGRDAIMLAPTREMVAELNVRARADRLAKAAASGGRQVELVDGCAASAGDTIITRDNDRRLAISASDWVKNGDRWTVNEVRPDGGLRVTHLGTGLRAYLPAAYVAASVALGYATTVHAAQGVTAQACHVVAAGAESRQLLYVAMTRGRDGNYLYLAVAGDGDPHTVITRDALLPPTAVDVLARILARDGSQTSATSTRRAAADPVQRLRQAAARYSHTLARAAETHLGPQALTALEQHAEVAVPGLTHADAWPTLRADLALQAAAGRDPRSVLDTAIAQRELDTAVDPAAVLDWRLDPTHLRTARRGPLPWLPGVPAALAADPVWSPCLTARAGQVADLAAQVSAMAGEWTPTTAPTWARPLLDRDRHLAADLAVWRAATAVLDTDPRPAGAPQPAAAPARHQKRLQARVTTVLGDPHAATNRWRPLAEAIDPQITADPAWPALAERLATAARAGLDVADLAAQVAAERPLPDEQPAAALWWRLARHLPAALAAGSGGQDDDARLRADELATALTWRVGLLADPQHAPVHACGAPRDEDAPPDPDDVPPPPDPDENLHRGDQEKVTPVQDERAPVDAADFGDGALAEQTRAEIEAILARSPSPGPGAPVAPAPVPADVAEQAQRIRELNQLAADFFAARYRTSWAADYLRARVGSDLADDARFAPGYAPAGWRSLTGYLRHSGVSDEDLLAAGLATRSANGGLIDRFRDRLILPIHSGEGIVGFVARRNPTHDQDDAGDRHGPKYLNTAQTPAYRKGDHLYGMTTCAQSLADGAKPVLVEGPIDAIAVTLVGDGLHVGVATLGTALTGTQADLLRPYLGPDGDGVIVATDPDAAGCKAAARAWWMLAARRGNPGRLRLPDGVDPSDAYTRDPEVLRAGLTAPDALASTLVDQAITAWAPRLNTAEGRIGAMHEALAVIGAMPPQTLLQSARKLIADLDLLPGTVFRELADITHAWTLDPHGQAHRQLQTGTPPAPVPPVPPAPPVRVGAAEPRTAAEATPAPHWQAIAVARRPHLVEDPEWPRLLAALDRAHTAPKPDAVIAVDVADLFATALDEELPAHRPAWHLRCRLIEAVPAAATPRLRGPAGPPDGPRQHRPAPPAAPPPGPRTPRPVR
jgi:DNA primase catalytic core